MRLYRLHVTDSSPEGESAVKWVGSLAACSTARAEWAKFGYKKDRIVTEEIDVPTDKKGLLEFLNNG